MKHHESDLITRAGLERIREHCESNYTCHDCKILPICKEIERLYPKFYLERWTDDDITEILKITRNYMERTFIESLEKIVRLNGECDDIKCIDCPFSPYYDYENKLCSSNSLNQTHDIDERADIAKMLLDYYKGEVE